MENFNDPFYDGLTQDEKAGVYLHVLATWAAGDNGGKRMTKTWKRQVRDEWLTKRAFDAIPGVQEMKVREAAALRVTCEALYAEMAEWVDRIGDDVLALALARTMDVYVMDRLQPFEYGHPTLTHLLCLVRQAKDLDLLTDEDYDDGA